MSLIFMFFYWVIIPTGIVVGTWWLFTEAKNGLLKGGAILAGVAVFAGYLWLAVGEQWMLDQKVRELCATDGGIEVYEKVLLSDDLINQYDQIQIPDKSDATPSDLYYYETKKRFYRKGTPQVSRREYQIIRRNDKKILGRLVIYGRGGGGLPGPWHGSSFTCPKLSELPNFEAQVFVKDAKELNR